MSRPQTAIEPGPSLCEHREGMRTIVIQTPESLRTSAQFFAAIGAPLYRYCREEEVRLKTARGNEVELKFKDDPGFAALADSITLDNQDESEPLRCFIPDSFARLLARRGADATGPLAMRFERRTDQTAMELVWSPESLDESRLVQLAAHCEALLTSAIRTPHEPVSRLRMMSEEELHRILVEQNGVSVPFERVTIPDAFETQVRRTPNATALIHNGHTISYYDLHASALRLAASLQNAGVGMETLVGVSLDDPVAVAVVYLGTLMAGGAFVALDHFLEIGGDSIIATLTSMHIEAHLRWTAGAASRFEFPTVRTLAAELVGKRAGDRVGV